MSDSHPSHPQPSSRPHVFRRRYIIDRRRQFRTTLLTTSLVIILLVMVNLGFAMLRSSQTAMLSSAAPQLSQMLEAQDTKFAIIMAVVSVALIVAVAVTTIIQTHRTAGAVYAVKQRFNRVKDGDLQVSLRLRARDNLQDLEGPFNAMMASIRDRVLSEASTIEALADKVDSGATDAAEALRELARSKRQSAS